MGYRRPCRICRWGPALRPSWTERNVQNQGLGLRSHSVFISAHACGLDCTETEKVQGECPSQFSLPQNLSKKEAKKRKEKKRKGSNFPARNRTRVDEGFKSSYKGFDL